MRNFVLQPLPPRVELETLSILKKLPEIRDTLGELRGILKTIPNESILIDTLALQEAKDSSEIENIITTHDELFKAKLFAEQLKSPAVKEVENYVGALMKGYSLVRENKMLTNNYILEIQAELEKNYAGFRKLPGTDLKNSRTGEVVYTPPQHADEIITLMTNLEAYINDDQSTLDPLLKMAVIHYQFESIHPFYDGNGRTGRIINILYLILKGLLPSPVLYLSRYFIYYKSDYYQKLQNVRDQNEWISWIDFVLDGVHLVALQTINQIHKIKNMMLKYEIELRQNLPKLYSQDLINNLFRYPYTRIEFLQTELNVSRITATKYLEQMVEVGLLTKAKVGKHSYYINQRLLDLLMINHFDE